ncbi:hypothetical protein [Methylobacterium haplocladii]|uniref:Uncharacterized protein n=1 Tax=Methylobacterium haplocladii TaxID=1176176 RepID=A0A512IVA6_9HYPH|nr:hypothetical protein [Methylobacterium haplocladii]GEP01637.1 hypothetical protein MHA02_40240 [Methylobacterium haplocladii]GJD85927.1 hypothetical protein HPGCJGGD_3822 [Methylobacterium haplocladii]GLS59938.1 hypothetical protein GCM10007887_26120 [Methylobacterium haplocladii]
MSGLADTLAALRRGDLAGVRELRLTGGLSEFPREIFGLADSLEVLDLSGGTLADLPADIGRLRPISTRGACCTVISTRTTCFGTVPTARRY